MLYMKENDKKKKHVLIWVTEDSRSFLKEISARRKEKMTETLENMIFDKYLEEIHPELNKD